MNSNKTILFLSLFLIGVLSIGSANAGSYEVDWYSDYPTGVAANNPAIMWLPSLSTDAACSVTMNPYANINFTVPFTSTASYFSPNNNLIGVAERDFTYNITCSPYGEIETTATLNNLIETRVSATMTAVYYGWITLNGGIICATDGNDITFTMNNETIDQRGTASNLYTYAQPGVSVDLAEAMRRLERINFQNCNMTTVNIQDNLTTNAPGINSYWYHYFVFNSQDLGLINVSIYEPAWFNTIVGAAASGFTYEAYIWPLDLVAANYSICSTFPCETELFLNDNTDYVLMTEIKSTHPDTPGARTVVIHPNMSITINNYEPDYTCGDWSDCANGTRWRRCDDTGGIAPSRIENDGCYSLPNEELWLGFELGYDTVVWHTFLEWTCGCSVDYRELRYPYNWDIITPQKEYDDYGVEGNNVTGYLWDVLRLTSEYSADGDGVSLKMWYIPPKTHMPLSQTVADSDSIVCGNATYGYFPGIGRSANASTFIEKGVTFPSPYMTLYFNVRKCREPELQYPAPYWWLFGEVCGPNACYTRSGNCTEPVRGRIWTQLYDAENNESVFHESTEVVESATWEAREYKIEELNITRNYTVRFGVFPETESNLNPNSYCIYLDNINFYVRNQELVCESYCDTEIYGLLHKATEIDGACSYVDIQLSPVCIDEQEIIDKIEDHEDFCDPRCEEFDYAYYRWDNETYYWEVIYNSDNCVDWCFSDQTEEEMTDVLDIDGAVNMFSFFLSPLFLSIFISLGLGGLITMKTKESTIGLITIMLLLTGFTVFQYFPAWMLIVVIIISGFLLARGTLGAIGGN